MKKPISLLLTLIVFYSIGYAQKGTVNCADPIKSEIFENDQNICVYLPPGYHESSRPYPVVYLLHGMWGDETNWAVKGEAANIADRLIATGEIPEMIIVMPDGFTDGYYINHYDKTVKWEDYFYEELIPQIESKYRVLKSRSTRAITGLSMGGFGSLYHALKHPDYFKYCYAMSAAVWEIKPIKDKKSRESFENKLNIKLYGPPGKNGFPPNYKQHSILDLIRDMEPLKTPSEQSSLPKITLDCGDDDFLIEANLNLYMEMKKKNLAAELRVRDGAHTWEYWRTGLELSLKTIGYSFRN